MIKKDLQTIEKLSEGNGLLEKFYKIKISGVSTDTREIVDGNLFVPLIGENFDGHKFLDKAIEKYSEAMKLAKTCGDKLNEATESVNKILTENGKVEDFKIPEEN